MRKFSFIFFILLNIVVAIVKAQAPDLSKFKNDNEKIKAWLGYCAELRLNKNGTANNYVILEEAGLKGLQLVKPNDDSDKASFFLYIA